MSSAPPVADAPAMLTSKASRRIIWPLWLLSLPSAELVRLPHNPKPYALASRCGIGMFACRASRDERAIFLPSALEAHAFAQGDIVHDMEIL